MIALAHVCRGEMPLPHDTDRARFWAATNPCDQFCAQYPFRIADGAAFLDESVAEVRSGRAFLAATPELAARLISEHAMAGHESRAAIEATIRRLAREALWLLNGFDRSSEFLSSALVTLLSIAESEVNIEAGCRRVLRAYALGLFVRTVAAHDFLLAADWAGGQPDRLAYLLTVGGPNRLFERALALVDGGAPSQREAPRTKGRRPPDSMRTAPDA
jgi:hypothetical protein